MTISYKKTMEAINCQRSPLSGVNEPFPTKFLRQFYRLRLVFGGVFFCWFILFSHFELNVSSIIIMLDQFDMNQVDVWIKTGGAAEDK